MLISTDLSLSHRISGRVVTAGDDAWDAARHGFNLAIDQHPAAVVFPANVPDVVAIVDYANEHDLRIAPQATGHNPGPLGDLDGMLLVNVEDLDEIEIDPEARRVRVGGGVRWRDVTPLLAEHGLAALHGSSPDVGIAGYSLGGGMGWLARKHGMQTNSVTALELVTADGRFIRTDAEHRPELFWALRGGNGNFGVVTAIEFTVYPVAEVYAGQMFFGFERSAEVLHAWARLLPTLPEEMMTWAAILHIPDMPEMPDELRGQSFTVVFATHLGDEPEGRALLRSIRELGPDIDTFAMVPPLELGDLAMDPRDPLPAASGHRMLDRLPAEAVDALLAVAGPGGSDAGGQLGMVQLRHMGGALSRVAPGAGARATLPGEVVLFTLGLAPDPVTTAAVEASIERLVGAVEPYAGSEYPNFVEVPADASRFFDADTWRRLREVKAAYDPAERFRGNHYIPPAD